jgi:hypothetical protein
MRNEVVKQYVSGLIGAMQKDERNLTDREVLGITLTLYLSVCEAMGVDAVECVDTCAGDARDAGGSIN